MKILLLNQCFYPDVVSTAQHTADLARALAERGHSVTVLASSRGYDDPSLRFAAEETWHGIQIHRVPSLPTGKGKRWKRALNIAGFFLACASRLLTMQRFDLVIALTSPPLISAIAALFVRIRGGRSVFWIMDLNPDEAIAAGWLREGSATARLLESVLRYSARAAERVIVLDRFMRDRMMAKGLPPSRLVVLPPWSHDRAVQYDHEGRAAFRARHGLSGKYVVMYSGNHSPCHPLDTVLAAALALAGDSTTAFCFVGGGSEHAKVRRFAETHCLSNIVCLPYQPLSELAGSLSAADLHLVVMGAPMAGLVHPCKIYNVLSLGIPVLYIGPDRSHVSDIAAANPGIPIAQAAHGDTARVVECIRARTGAGLAPHEGMKAAALAFSADRLLPLYADVVESDPHFIERSVPETRAVESL